RYCIYLKVNAPVMQVPELFKVHIRISFWMCQYWLKALVNHLLNYRDGINGLVDKREFKQHIIISHYHQLIIVNSFLKGLVKIVFCCRLYFYLDIFFYQFGLQYGKGIINRIGIIAVIVNHDVRRSDKFLYTNFHHLFDKEYR